MKTSSSYNVICMLLMFFITKLAAWSQTSIPINNPGFESPELEPGESGTPLGWTTIGSSPVEVSHPTTVDFPEGAPEGFNIAYVAAFDAGDGLGQVLTDPAAVLAQQTKYSLTVQVGQADGIPFDGFRIQLLADGELLKEIVDSVTPGEGEFTLATLQYIYDETKHSHLISEPLEIRLLSQAADSGTTYFDDVQLTAELYLPEVTSGFDFFVNAREADNSNEFWNDLVAENPTGLGLRIDKSTGNEVTRQIIAVPTPMLTHAFQFPGGKTGNVGGALLVNSNTTTTRSFNNLGWHNQPVTIEMWIKPDDLTTHQILFEDGGATGMGLFVNNNQIQFRKLGGSGLISYNIDTDPNGVLAADATDGFFQIVGTYNTSGGAMRLFINGELVGTGTASGGGSWSGGDAAAFGTRGGNNTGGLGNGNMGTVSFEGQIALIRAYRNRILTNEEVEENYFATIAPDLIPPQIAEFTPQNSSTGIYPGISQLVATFDEPVVLTGEGAVTIRNLTSDTEEVIELPAASVEIIGEDLIIHLDSNLPFDSEFAVQISGDAVADFSDNLFAGIDDDTTWSFITAEQNLNPPVITAKLPEHQAKGVPFTTNIEVTFDQNIILGTGDIVIKDLEDDSTTQTIPVSDATQVSATDNVLFISPASLLKKGTDYAVLIPSSAARNFSDVNIAGITDETEWTFRTSNLTGQLGILDLEARDGINPSTGEPWQAGDRYHLAYVTSDETPATSTSIADYNAFVQGDANSQNVTGNAGTVNLGNVKWFALGSTSTVNAIHNAVITGSVWDIYHSLNPGDSATGDGFLASDAADFWDFEFPGTGTNSGNPLSRVEDGADRNIFTGTVSGGVAAGGTQPLGEGTASRRQWTGWRTNWTGSNATETNTNPLAMAAISQALFIIDLDDDIAPELVSIIDNVEGGPLALDDEPVITYTVTFNEAMLPSTVEASDFGNAGSAGFTINSVVQQEDPAVFWVTVTPTSAGTLRLQINQSAALTDLNGNPLDTSTALLDDTVIEITATTSGYAAWADGFPGLTNPDPTFDFDGGGLATALEWVLGGDPTDASDDLSIMPKIDNTSDPDGKLLFTFRRNIDAHEDVENTTIVVEYSSDLVEWTPADHEGTEPDQITIDVVPDGFGPGLDEVTVAIPPNKADDGRLFVRLKVAVQAPPE